MNTITKTTYEMEVEFPDGSHKPISSSRESPEDIEAGARKIVADLMLHREPRRFIISIYKREYINGMLISLCLMRHAEGSTILY
jgi:hypothetical protein